MKRLVFAVLLASCKPVAAPPPGDVAVSLAGVETPLGVTLVSACVPSGPELCFNAIDDNCNGVVDEGCGISTGIVQFTIAWGDSPADVKLRMDPEGTDRGLSFHPEHCPHDNCNGQNVQNLFFDGADPPRGKYNVTVELADPKTASLPVHVRFGARIGSKSYGADLALDKRGDKKTFTFSF